MKFFLNAALIVTLIVCLPAEAGKKKQPPQASGSATSPSKILPIQKSGQGPNTAPLHAGLYNNEQGSPVLTLIGSAQKSVDVEIYEMGDTDFRAAIRAALARNVKVRIVKDPNPLGESCKYFENQSPVQSTPNQTGSTSHGSPNNGQTSDCVDQQKLVAEVNATGGQFVPFNKTNLCGIEGKSCFEHGKMVIVDQSTVMLTTGNFNATNLCDLDQNPSTCNRDYSYITKDRDYLATLESIFEADLAGNRYDVSTMISGASAQDLTISPVSLKPILDFINSATTTLDIETQYLEQPDINQALIKAAGRGVKVSLTVASFCSFSAPTSQESAKDTATYTAFDQAGISTSTFTKRIQVKGVAGYLHAKVMVADGRRAWMGSVNGSSESVEQNREFGIFFSDAADIAMLKAQIQSDHSNAGAESWSDSLKCVAENTK